MVSLGATGIASPSLARGVGRYRSLGLSNSRTGEQLRSVYWVEGEYIPDALDAFSHILRDWRRDAVKAIDPRALDIMAATQALLECEEPFEILSGYRTPQTNAMLRRRSRAVARNSYHVQGMAVDLKLKSRSVSQVSRAARSLNAGGVGRYSRSSFTHIDSGPVRGWGR